MSNFIKLAKEARQKGQYDEYVSYIKQGTDNNDPDCIYYLALCYYYGYYKFEMNHKIAFKMFEKNEGAYYFYF